METRYSTWRVNRVDAIAALQAQLALGVGGLCVYNLKYGQITHFYGHV
jgi:hypothetical protein